VLLTTKEAAELAGVATNTVSEWCRTGKVKAERRQNTGRAYPNWCVDKADLIRFLSLRRTSIGAIWCPTCKIFYLAAGEVCPRCGKRDRHYNVILVSPDVISDG